jgi:hypothetical protein
MQWQLRDAYNRLNMNLNAAIDTVEDVVTALGEINSGPTDDEIRIARERGMQNIAHQYDLAEQRRTVLQGQADLLTRTCSGPVTLQSVEKHPRQITARVCGSLALWARGDTDATEPASVTRQ